MSAEALTRAMLFALALCSGGAVLAADDKDPEADFLEYLGMWEESDEDWMIVDGATRAENETRSDPEPESEESPETDDES